MKLSLTALPAKWPTTSPFQPARLHETAQHPRLVAPASSPCQPELEWGIRRVAGGCVGGVVHLEAPPVVHLVRAHTLDETGSDAPRSTHPPLFGDFATPTLSLQRLAAWHNAMMSFTEMGTSKTAVN